MEAHRGTYLPYTYHPSTSLLRSVIYVDPTIPTEVLRHAPQLANSFPPNMTASGSLRPHNNAAIQLLLDSNTPDGAAIKVDE